MLSIDMLKKILFILLGRWKIFKGKYKELYLIKDKVSFIINWYFMFFIFLEDYFFLSVVYSMVLDYFLKKIMRFYFLIRMKEGRKWNFC